MLSGRKGLACIGEFLGKWNDLMAESLKKMGQLAWRSLWEKSGRIALVCIAKPMEEMDKLVP